MTRPIGPEKYVINRDTISKILLIAYLCESLAIHAPVKRLIDKK